MLARAAATAGDLDTATAALRPGQDQPRMKPYEPEWDLAEAAVLAAGLRMDEAADRAAWAAGVAADSQEWNIVAGRLSRRRPVRRGPARPGPDARGRGHGRRHARPLFRRPRRRPGRPRRRRTRRGGPPVRGPRDAAVRGRGGRRGRARPRRRRRPPRRPGQRPALHAGYRAALRGRGLTLADRRAAPRYRSPRGNARSPRSRVGGYTDPAIAERLDISVRTVQTHLAHVYAKLGINRRTDLASRLS